MKRKTAVNIILEKMNLMSNTEFQSWMLNMSDSLISLEKEQMKDVALHNVTRIPAFRKIFEEQFEQYYTQTFGDDAQVPSESK